MHILSDGEFRELALQDDSCAQLYKQVTGWASDAFANVKLKELSKEEVVSVGKQLQGWLRGQHAQLAAERGEDTLQAYFVQRRRAFLLRATGQEETLKRAEDGDESAVSERELQLLELAYFSALSRLEGGDDGADADPDIAKQNQAIQDSLRELLPVPLWQLPPETFLQLHRDLLEAMNMCSKELKPMIDSWNTDGLSDQLVHTYNFIFRKYGVQPPDVRVGYTDAGDGLVFRVGLDDDSVRFAEQVQAESEELDKIFGDLREITESCFKDVKLLMLSKEQVLSVLRDVHEGISSEGAQKELIELAKCNKLYDAFEALQKAAITTLKITVPGCPDGSQEKLQEHSFLSSLQMLEEHEEVRELAEGINAKLSSMM